MILTLSRLCTFFSTRYSTMCTQLCCSVARASLSKSVSLRVMPWVLHTSFILLKNRPNMERESFFRFLSLFFLVPPAAFAYVFYHSHPRIFLSVPDLFCRVLPLFSVALSYVSVGDSRRGEWMKISNSWKTSLAPFWWKSQIPSRVFSDYLKRGRGENCTKHYPHYTSVVDMKRDEKDERRKRDRGRDVCSCPYSIRWRRGRLTMFDHFPFLLLLLLSVCVLCCNRQLWMENRISYHESRRE